MRLKTTGALKPLQSFPNLVLGDRSSANLPRTQSHGGEQEWLTCPVPLRMWHRLSCLHWSQKGPSKSQKERACLKESKPLCPPRACIGVEQGHCRHTQEILRGYWMDFAWAHSKELVYANLFIFKFLQLCKSISWKTIDPTSRLTLSSNRIV